MNFIDNFMIFVINYFDVKRKSNRLEFNTTILIYSILLIAFLGMTTDFEKLNSFIEFFTHNVSLPLHNGTISENKATAIINNLDYSFIPMKTLTFFPLLLIPLFARRLNDTILHPAFIAPIVIVYVFDFAKEALGFDFSFRLYDAMSFYNFVLVSILCILPSSEKEYLQNKK